MLQVLKLFTHISFLRKQATDTLQTTGRGLWGEVGGEVSGLGEKGKGIKQNKQNLIHTPTPTESKVQTL